MYHNGWYGHGGTSWMGALWGVLMLAFWVLVIVGLVLIIKRYAHHHEGAIRDDPLEIAKARYARGEINKDEFTQLKKDLS